MTAYMTSSMTRSMSEQLMRVNTDKKPAAPTTVDAGKYELRITLIRANGGTQTRAQLDSETISDYATAMDSGASLPLITVFYDGSEYWLADGFHRLAAAQRLNHRTIWTEVKQGTRRDAVLYSAGANGTHGLRRTDKDKRRAVETLLRDEEWQKWSDREIARRCAVGHNLVSEMRPIICPSMTDATRRVNRGGKEIQMNTGKIGKGKAKKQPTPAAQSTAQGIVNTTFNQTVDELAIALTGAILQIVAFVTVHKLTLVEKVEILKRLEKSSNNPGSNNTFDEIMRTGGFHYGQDFKLWCDFVNDSVQKIQRALDSVAEHHRLMAANEQRAAQSATPPAQPAAPEPNAPSFSIEQQGDVYTVVMVMSGFKSHNAAAQAIANIQRQMEDCK